MALRSALLNTDLETSGNIRRPCGVHSTTKNHHQMHVAHVKGYTISSHMYHLEMYHHLRGRPSAGDQTVLLHYATVQAQN